jgi:iron complex transport system substrate-binding protein
LVLLLVWGVGCSGGVKQPAAPAEPAGPYPLTVVDDNGKAVEIAAEPNRIVSLIPSLTEILFALDVGERVVGVTNFCNYPEEALAIDKIGDAWTPNVEKILSLSPDVVLSPRGSALDDALSLLEDNGIVVLVFDPKTLDEINDTIVRVARLVGVEDRGAELAAKLAADRQAFSTRVQKISPGERPRVFVVLDTDYLYTVGDGEYLSEMIETAGGLNAASGRGQGYPLLSEEILFEIDPDIIICTFPISDQVLAKGTWQELVGGEKRQGL